MPHIGLDSNGNKVQNNPEHNGYRKFKVRLQFRLENTFPERIKLISDLKSSCISIYFMIAHTEANKEIGFSVTAQTFLR